MLTKNIIFLAATVALRSQKNTPGVYGWCDFTWANANKAGYNTGSKWDNNKHEWSNLPRSNLSKARVKVCVNVQFGKDKCEWSNYVDNPYESGTS